MRTSLRFTIREIFLLTTIVALCLALAGQYVAFRRAVRATEEMRREVARGINMAREHEIALINDGYVKIGKHIYRVDDEGYVIFDENSALTPEALPYYPAMSYPAKK